MLRGYVMKFRQLIVFSIFSVFALSAQAAFVAEMLPAQLWAGIADQRAAGSNVAAVVANAVAAQPLTPSSTPLATPTTQTVYPVSCS